MFKSSLGIKISSKPFKSELSTEDPCSRSRAKVPDAHLF